MSAQHLPPIFAALAPLLGHGYGYLWIALLIGVESIGIPVYPARSSSSPEPSMREQAGSTSW